MQKVLRIFLVVLVFVDLSQLVCAGTKPVSGLRDYNGTFDGAPGTGSITYSTLYRDNYSESPCVGEGCGSHPGVDIRVGSGTAVYAALSGEVILSTCNFYYDSSGKPRGWGGVMVTRSQDPYTGTTVYPAYAHLRERYYASGWVSEGTMIGRSGGSPSDPCPGASTGAHLHFQVDKQAPNPFPWFPSSADTPDYGFQVTQNTYNPVPLITNGFRWTFSQDGFKEYWTPQNVSSSGVSGGAFWIDGNSDPWIWRWPSVACGRINPCSAQFAIEANLYRTLTLIMDSSCVSNPVKAYFVTSTDTTWNEDKVVTFNYSPGIQIYDVNMASNWRWSGIITGLRIDPAMNCGSWWDPTYFHSLQLRR